MRISALRRALVRLLWNSVADDAACSCIGKDRCPECEAMAALGLSRWRGAKSAARRLTALTGRRGS